MTSALLGKLEKGKDNTILQTWLDREKGRQVGSKRVGECDYYIAGQASGKEGKVCVLPSPPLPNAQFKTSRFVFLRDSAVGVVRIVLLNLSKRQVDMFIMVYHIECLQSF